MEEMLVIGAAGGIGRQVVEAALAEGWRVTAVLRNPSKLDLRHPLLNIVQGDVLVAAAFEDCLTAASVVVVTTGVGGGLGGDKPTTLYSAGASTVLEAMRRRGARRVFFISASGIEISPVLPAVVRFLAKYILQKLLRHGYADLRLMESKVKGSSLEWTIVRPPRLTNKPVTGKYRFAVNSFLRNCLSISRGDVAHFIVHHAGDRGTYRGIVEIGY